MGIFHGILSVSHNIVMDLNVNGKITDKLKQRWDILLAMASLLDDVYNVRKHGEANELKRSLEEIKNKEC